jgi:hypothetical protein
MNRRIIQSPRIKAERYARVPIDITRVGKGGPSRYGAARVDPVVALRGEWYGRAGKKRPHMCRRSFMIGGESRSASGNRVRDAVVVP